MEVWFSARPITFAGEIVDWSYGKGHLVNGGVTLCGKPVGGERWEKAGYRTGREADCKTCLRRAGAS